MKTTFLPRKTNTVYTFIKQDGCWYYKSSRAGDGQSFTSLDSGEKILDVLSAGCNELSVQLNSKPIEGGIAFELKRHCAAPQGGGIYCISNGDSKLSKLKYWIRDLALLVFGEIPEKFFARIV